MNPLPTGSTIGILGGGQLGRMLALAAAQLGLQCHVYSPEPDACALQVVGKRTNASFSDLEALERFASDCDVITYESENVPQLTLEIISRTKPVLPNPTVLAKTQDRLKEKDFVRSLGIGTANFSSFTSEIDLESAVAEVGRPAIMKTRRFGYDGLGQRRFDSYESALQAWEGLGRAPCILESLVNFEREVSIVATRSHDGRCHCFDVAENVHANHVLRTSTVPAAISADQESRARAIVTRIADGLGYVGTLAVEMFVVNTNGPAAILVNEIAPRVHNSGHWTLNGASVSQFEQHIRAICGWPLLPPLRLGAVRMENLFGAEAEQRARAVLEAGASIHLYGKMPARDGRKTGHLTFVTPQRPPSDESDSLTQNQA